MCGIVGLIARTGMGFTSEDMTLIEGMSIVDTLRGRDSTGFMSVYRNRQVDVIKIGTHPFNLFRCNEWTAFRQTAINRGRMIVGHNRAATKGEVNTENAHPFVENNIILVHNGTLWDHSNLTKADVKVDSHAIAHALAEKSPQEVLPEIKGAFALVWYDTKTEKLYCARNDDRPLCIIETRQAWVIASEPMIAALPLSKVNRKIENMFDLEPGTLLEFDTTGNYKKGEFDLKKARPHSGKETTTASTRNGISNITKEAVNQDCCYVDGNSVDFHPGTRQMDPETGRPKNQSSEVVPPEIVNLRQALAGKAKQKRSQEAGSPNCVLTQNKDTVQDGRGPLDLSKMSSEERSAYENSRKIQITHQSLVTGRAVIFKPLEIVEKPHCRYGFTGKLHQPDECLLDVAGFYPHYLGRSEIEQEMLGKWCLGKVMYVTNTIAGSSVFLGDCIAAGLCETFGQRNTPIAFWSYALSDCDCDKCGKALHPWEREFTAINKRAELVHGMFAPLNKIVVTCPDCVEQTLKGEMLNVFKAKRDQVNKAISQSVKLQQERTEQAVKYAEDKAKDADRVVALPDRKSVGTEPVGKNGSVIVLPGPSSLQ